MDANFILRRRYKQRSSEQQGKRRRLLRGIIALMGSLTLALSVLILLGALFYANITTGLPAPVQMADLLNPINGSLLQPSRLYDRSGSHLLMVMAPWDTPRSYVPLDPILPNHIPETLTRATVALVDPGFWTQPGNRIESLTSPEEHPGLAQKLVFNLLLWDEAPTWRRAAREQLLAAQLVSQFGREKIIEWYLNSANYGHYAYGAEAAAQLYLGKPLADLNLAEAALLASVSESPAINPLDAPAAALQHEQEALNQIETRGMATADEVEQARKFKIIFKTSPPTATDVFPTFSALALAQLEKDYNLARVEQGGMQVLTTLDYDLQARTQCALQTQISRLNNTGGQGFGACDGAGSLPPLPPASANQAINIASAVVLDPQTGELLALAGDPNSRNSEAISLGPHQPGTLLTPFIFLTGFTRGLSPSSLLWDLPPKNSDPAFPIDSYKGPMRLRTALTGDNLGIAGQVFNQMGAGLVEQTMAPFGLDIPATSVKEFLNSSQRTSIIQIAQTYGVFATLGTLTKQDLAEVDQPSALLSVRGSDGQVLSTWGNPVSAQVLSPQLAYLLTDVLSANFSDLSFPAAFKAGASLDGNENWAAGYTPRRVVVVWMGGTSSLAHSATEGLWDSIMQSASQNLPPDDWSQPAGMVRMKVCDPSGMLPTEACPNVVDEIFIDGYQPMQEDTLYRKYAVNRETNLLATVFTPQQLVEDRVYMLLPPEAEAWAKAVNQHSTAATYDTFHPPSQYDNIQPPTPDPNANISSPAMFAELHGNVRIVGTAGGTDFSYYRLQFGQGLNPDTWTQIGGDVSKPVGNGPLAEWDTSGLTGLYSLQLLVVHKDHSLQIATVQVTLK